MASGTERRKSGGTPVDPTRIETRQEVEEYSPKRVAEFLLNNAVSADDYTAALEEVRKLGIDPATIPHEKPSGA